MTAYMPILLLAQLAAPALAATPLSAEEPLTQVRQARASTRPARPAARSARIADLRCSGKPGAADDSLTGELDLATMALDNSRSQGRSPLIDASRSAAVVDERCGTTRAPLADSLNYYVTPRYYWGEDILQLPKASVGSSGSSSFTADLHICQYDGDWSSSNDIALQCTLAVREP